MNKRQKVLIDKINRCLKKDSFVSLPMAGKLKFGDKMELQKHFEITPELLGYYKFEPIKNYDTNKKRTT